MGMKTTRLTTEEAPLPKSLEVPSSQLLETTAQDWVPTIIYGRASQDRNKMMRSIDDQIAECISWCTPIRWRPEVEIRDSDRSASQWRTKEREGFDEAIRLIESGNYKGFATWEPSRAGRDLEIFLQLRKACQRNGVLYLTHGRVYDLSRSDDSFIMGFEFLRAEADANTMRDRQLRTTRLSAENGRPHGRLPYGYRRVYDERTGALIRQEPDPHTGQIVRDAAQAVLGGQSMWKIGQRLQDAGELTPMKPWAENPRGWETHTLRQILKNPTIAGKRVHRGEIIGDAQWEGLVSWEDFQRLQRLLKDPSRRVKGAGGTQAKTLMVFIARCHYCGRGLKRGKHHRKNKGIQVRYQCLYRGCYKTSISQPALDTYVEEVVLAWFEQPENLALLTTEGNEWLEKASLAQQEIEALRQRWDEASNEFSSGNLTLATLKKVERSIKPQIETAERALIPPIADERVRDLVSSGDVRTAWAGLPLAEQRKIIKAAFDVRITRTGKKGQSVFNPERVHIVPRFS